MYKIINKKKRFLVRTADLMGRGIFFLKKQSQARLISPHQIKKILIIRLAYLGDVVMTLPILQPLHNHFPGAQITFLTNSSATELLQGNPYLDKILSYDPFWFYQKGVIPGIKEYFQVVKEVRKEAFDLVLDLRGDLRNILLIAYLSKAPYRVSYEVGGGGYLLSSIVPFLETKHKVEYHLDILRFLGIDPQGWDWNIYLNPTEIQEMETTLKAIGIKPGDLIIGIHPGARKPLKCWEPENFSLLADSIIEAYSARIIFFGAPHEIYLIENIRSKMKRASWNMAGKTTLRQLAAAIRCCCLFIGNDSAPIHIAAAMNAPAVAIFGPSKSIETRPYGDIHRVVEIENMPCRSNCDEDKCHFERPRECIRLISPQAVFQAVEQQLARSVTQVSSLERT